MKINFITIKDWKYFLDSPKSLIERIESEVFIVRNFIDSQVVDLFKRFCLNFSAAKDASWHPCFDGCPDYHRIHHQYPKAHVKSTQHAYYYHPWNENFFNLNGFESLGEIFEFKARAIGKTSSDFFQNKPSQGQIARIVCHQYPTGGGGQEEHIDPVSPFAKVQTIIQASVPGKDYFRGGLYINDPVFGIMNIDPLTTKGDLILASPSVRHGVASIDPDEPLDWEAENGRWIIMPIIINSDHVTDPGTKPKMTTRL